MGIAQIGMGALTAEVGKTDIKEKTPPGTIRIDPATGKSIVNPGDSKVKIDSPDFRFLATGNYEITLDPAKLSELSEQNRLDLMGPQTVVDGKLVPERIAKLIEDKKLELRLGDQSNPRLSISSDTGIKEGARPDPAKSPPAPAVETAPAPAATDLDEWYSSKKGAAKVQSFIDELDNLEDRTTANQWKAAIQSRKYDTIKKIQEEIGTGTDGMLGGGSLRALKAYAESKSQVAEEEVAPERTATPSRQQAPARTTPAAPNALTEQSAVDRLIAESRARRAKMLVEISPETRSAAESAGLKISQIEANIPKSMLASLRQESDQADQAAVRSLRGYGTSTPPISTVEDAIGVEELRFQGTLTEQQKRAIKGAYQSQAAEGAKLTRPNVPTAVSRLPILPLSSAPKGAKAGDVIIQKPGNMAFWMTYDPKTMMYTHPSGAQYNPFQVATMAGSRVIK